ncbi:MAG TPA: hypothetical protein VMB81_13450, partial [Candidatus Sulfotelmatobacter sp.]|nr:hypothetical protein [Candidatus Sulfotelmatobacter sp.]
VRTLRPGLPIVFLTGFADTEALAGDLRPERLVRKPFQPAELDGKLRAAVDEGAGAAPAA